jgi:ABC-2 type transport system permease protein
VRALPVAVVDLDNSSVSRTLRLYIGAAPEVRVVDAPGVASADDARPLLETGALAAVVVLPDGLEAGLKHGRHVDVAVAVDMSNILSGRNVYKAPGRAIGTVSAGAQLQLVTKLGERRARSLARVVPVVLDESFPLNPSTSYAVYLVPGLVYFLLNVWVLVVGATSQLPQHRGATASERLGAATAILLVGLALASLFAFAWLPVAGVRLQSAPGVLLALAAAFLAADLLSASLIMRAIPLPMTGMQVTVALAMLSLMLAGITWPADLFPVPLQLAADAMPFTPFARALQRLLNEPLGLAELRAPFALLGAQAAMFGGGLVVATRLRARGAALLARRAA